MASAADAALLQQLIDAVGVKAAEQIMLLWEQFGDWDVIVQLYPDLVDAWAAAAALVTADWYHRLLPDAPFDTRPAAGPSVKELADDVASAAATPDRVRALADSAQQRVFETSRGTVADNTRREGVLFVRVAQQDACPWCRVLATQPPRYLSKESAERSHGRGGGKGGRGHKCRCVGVPVRADEQWEPPAYVDDWARQYEKASLQLQTTNLDAVAKEMRPRWYEENKDALNERRRERYAEKKKEKESDARTQR